MLNGKNGKNVVTGIYVDFSSWINRLTAFILNDFLPFKSVNVILLIMILVSGCKPVVPKAPS